MVWVRGVSLGFVLLFRINGFLVAIVRLINKMLMGVVVMEILILIGFLVIIC